MVLWVAIASSLFIYVIFPAFSLSSYGLTFSGTTFLGVLQLVNVQVRRLSFIIRDCKFSCSTSRGKFIAHIHMFIFISQLLLH